MSIMEAMPPGFRFYPTEDELVSFYLNNKLDNNTRLDLLRDIDRVIPVLEIYSFNPSDLPKYSGELCEEDPEQWFFFIPRQESEARGGRPNRLTTTGYWKATGSPGYVYSKNRVIGLKRTMVFYRGRAPRGKKTEWKMNEYKAIAAGSSNGAAPKVRQEFSLCRVYNTTKCLRAFDRRPLGVAQGDEPTAQQAVGGGGDDVTRLHDSTIGPVAVANSPETSSSSGNRGQYPAAETAEGNFLDQMEIEDESLWNWDQVNWFSGL